MHNNSLIFQTPIKFVFIIIMILLSACTATKPTIEVTCEPTPQATNTPTLTSTPSPTKTPTQTPTPIPPGGEETPFKMAVYSNPIDPEAIKESAALSIFITEQTGLAFQIEYYDTYTDMLNDLSDYSLHAAWLPPLTYIYAQENQLAEVNLLTNHFGSYLTGTQFIAPLASGAKPYFNSEKNINSANAATALRQFQGKRPCWVNFNSATGYIVPAGILAQNSIQIQPGAELQSHSAVIRALYAGEICDFGATFSISGDPRTSSDLMTDFPNILEEMPIIWRSDPIVPNLNLSYHPNISDELRTQINLALFSYASTLEGQQSLSTAIRYNIQDLKFIESDIYDSLIDLIEILGVDPADLIGG